MLRKLGLLVWKNLLLRKRHYFVTALEIILPTLTTVIVVFFYMGLAFAKGDKATKNGIQYPDGVLFKVVTEATLTNNLEKLLCSFPPSPEHVCSFAFAPSTIGTDLIFQELSKELPKITWERVQDEESAKKFFKMATSRNNSVQGAVILDPNVGVKGASYKIRLVSNKLANTGELFPWVKRQGPKRDKDSIYEHEYYSKFGFTGLQILMDRALARMLTGKKLPGTISLQAFPYPPFQLDDNFSWSLFIVLVQAFVLGFMFMVPSIVRLSVAEKDTGIRELLKVNGLPGWMQWLGWMMNSMFILTISITIVIFLLFWTFRVETGAVLVHSDPSVWWLVLFLYCMSASSFCLFVSSFFRKPQFATMAGLILWLISYYSLFGRIEKNYQVRSLTEKMGASFLPNMALHLAVRVMFAFEEKDVGAQWHNMADPISSVDSLSLGFVILMFLVNICVYMALTVYVENVFPSEYGVRKPWYYIFQARTWWRANSGKGKIGPSPGDDEEVDVDAQPSSHPGFEAEPSGCPVGIDIQNLRKRFGRNKVAVDGISVKMYEGEVFALLGHNGAGKTTALSILTGMFAPSDGTATVNGFSIATDIDQVRENLGLCSQHNLLFDKLTVAEHLQFFGQLNGLSSWKAVKEAKELLEKLQLRGKSFTLPHALSGGQKRKLSLGIALMRGSKVMILDEPTRGMDPEARRGVWDLILKMRDSRTIVLTTHLMEEVDVLGDRVGIMASGKLQCCGTPLFLKKLYGMGYTLKLYVSENPPPPTDILAVVQKLIPNATVKSTPASNPRELLFILPTEAATTPVLSDLLGQLTARKEQLGICSIGLSLTTMDDVFIRIGELAEDKTTEPSEKNESESVISNKESTSGVVPPDTTTTTTTTETVISLKFDVAKATGLKLAMEQFLGLLAKKYMYTLRKRKLILSQLIIPILILIAAILVSNISLESDREPPPIHITLNSYNSPITLYSAAKDSALSSQMAKAIGPSAKKIPESSTLFDTFYALGRTDLASYRDRHIVGLEGNSSNINAMYSSVPYHAAPLAINIATNTLLRGLDPERAFQIQVASHPLQLEVDALPDPVFSQTVPIVLVVFMSIGLALLAASFTVFPIEEKIYRAKQLQVMTGVSPLIYWASAFLWDFTTVFIVVCTMTLCFPIFQSFNVFTSYGGAGVAFLILLIYGFSAIWFSYLVSFFSSTVAGAFAFVSLIHIVSGMVLTITVYFIEFIMGPASLASKVRWVGRLFPTFGASMSLLRFAEIATNNGRCNILSAEAKQLLCNRRIGPSTEKYYTGCCDKCKDIHTTCFEPTPYITWGYQKVDYEVPGIGQELLYMFLMGLVYLAVLIFLESEVIQLLLRRMGRVITDESAFNSNITDEDVLEESQRVKEMIASGEMGRDSLVVNILSKQYGSLAAVSKLSFGVHHGECFGLLGVNGAGKTTTFRMLTGDENCSCGTAYARSDTLDRKRTAYLSNVGYCPQFDGLIGELTGREMLQLFCRLRGVPGSYGKMEADKWLNQLGLAESANVQCGKYSGGMKRRLSIAMAMIGDPPVLMLDEPTSGVDPVSRRQFWKIVQCVKNKGQSIILTSHSMEECEALCSRLGIMVNGQLQCLGGVQHLKAKFAKGYSIFVKLKPVARTEPDKVDQLSAAISEKFGASILEDKHQSMLQYEIQDGTIPWDMIFKSMDDLKKQFTEIMEDYSVNESSLDEVFLMFARMKYEKNKTNVPLFKRLITCQF